MAFVDRNGLWPTWGQILSAVATVAVAAVVVAAVVSSAGTAGAAIGIGLTMAVGGSGATAATLTTIATWGCYAIAGAVGAFAVSDVTETFTGTNLIRDGLMGGNQQVYDFSKTLVYGCSAAITTLAVDNQGLKQYKHQENKQYDSFHAFKKDNGKAGEGMEWHHIVEQNQIKKSGFSPRDVYSTHNTIALDKSLHKEVSRYYSSKQSFTGGLRFRDWLTGKSFEEQYQWGMYVLNQVRNQK